jgi:YbbR domain-containing protein
MPRTGVVDRFLGVVKINIGAKLFSFFLAMVLWGVVLGSRSMEVTKEIPLEIVTNGELTPANEIPDRIAFKLSGPKAFLRAILDRREDPIRVNLAGAKSGLVTYRFFSDNIHLPIGVKVLSITPSSILIKLEQTKRREVPVQLELRGEPPEGYQLIRSEVRPEKIKIVGAESRVDSVVNISTLPVDVSSIRATGEKEVDLDLERQQVKLEGQAPRVFFQVEPIPANFRIRNVEVRVLSNHRARVEERTISLHVRAESKVLQNLDRSQVFGVVDLRGRAKGKYNEAVRVTLPDGVVAVKTIPERVNIVLE